MISHTVRANGRTARRPILTPEEAVAMLDKGFRFSIYRPEQSEFRLSFPLQVAEDRAHGTLTFMQEEDESTSFGGSEPVNLLDTF